MILILIYLFRLNIDISLFFHLLMLLYGSSPIRLALIMVSPLFTFSISPFPVVPEWSPLGDCLFWITSVHFIAVFFRLCLLTNANSLFWLIVNTSMPFPASNYLLVQIIFPVLLWFLWLLSVRWCPFSIFRLWCSVLCDHWI